jgi:WhiB family redox-sensing transcriptional regulator
MSLPLLISEGACHGIGTHLFFGPEGERGEEKRARDRQAAAVCAGCPVRAECLDYAISVPEKYGTWGGLNEDLRAKERNRRMKRAAIQRSRTAGEAA